ncbi:hypothetical protein FJM67_11340 [Maribrevibacterium harenarium]|uniref:5'-Nucleotidase C-terminal domain-containing protein n=1 Tax=Maribrevibacterium harenarium TaxID=2589817 RepID=A0A501WKC1_9GAMM|nr:5'-nucleotidase C-terminal domain-containing protein [Maribrevibacterium harenarium]TPE49798.1 hypothetical protein FJM67_11340 [Maribrevibacterium harenarium]
MKYLLRSVFVAGLVLSSTASLAGSLFFTSNTPDIFASDSYSLERLAGYVKAQKQHKQAFFLHGGDSLFPNPLSVYDNGSHMVSIMNGMGVDAMTVNRREFTRGMDQISLRTSESLFPMVLSNLKDIRTGRPIDGVMTDYIAPVGQMRIGILSYIADTVNSTYLMGEAEVDMSIEGLSPRIAALRQRGADYVVLVTEPDFIKMVPDSIFAGLDVLITTKETSDSVTEGRPLRIVSGGMDDELIEIEFTRQGVSAVVHHYLDAAPDPEVSAMIARYTGQLSIVLDQPLATLAVGMDSLRSNIRTGESAWGNVVVDALRHFTKADIAAVNSGSIRGYRTYPGGYQMTRRDVQAELPFGGAVYTVKMTPSEINNMLENSLSRIEESDGRYLQVAGLRVTYDTRLPVGQRLVNVTDEQGAPLTGFQYKVAITDYMLRGGDEYKFNQRQVIPDLTAENRYLWNIVSEFLMQSAQLTPTLKGRLVDLSKE